MMQDDKTPLNVTNGSGTSRMKANSKIIQISD